jgi:5'(3')-deoxyribonucleotidase
MRDKIILVDMDDTIFDYNGAKQAAILKNPGNICPQCEYRFYENLEPLPGAIEGFKTLQSKYKVKILTRPSILNPFSYTEKRVSVEKHLGFNTVKDLILSCDKTMVKGDFLIDDLIQEGDYKPEWELIQFGTKLFPNWEYVVKYLM